MVHNLDTIVARAKRRWFVYPGSDIYGGLANAWDLWPYGTQLRKNIYDQRWKYFVQQQPNIVAIDGALLMHPGVREASGHVAWFNDPLIDDKNTGQRFRADKIIEDLFETRRSEGKSDADIQETVDTYGAPNLIPDSRTLEQLKAFIIAEIPNNPSKKKKADRTDVRKFSLMLATQLGVIEDEWSKVWLRPETAQAMFVNFRNVTDTTRLRLPFGLAQIGKAFRNEITPGNFLFRTREFEQMEIQMFLHADDAPTRFEKFQEMAWTFWTEKLAFDKENLRLRDHADDELAHYASQARDFEFHYPRGWGELQGIHNRGNFDVTQHAVHSGKNMQYNDPYTGERFIPNVVELSMGLSRTILAAMFDAYEEEELEGGDTRTVLRFDPKIAPVTFAIFPLIKKDEDQVRIAEQIFADLSQDYVCEYDDGGAIGKRYRRQDEIGTPYCITVDHDSVNDGTVTIRHRDSMEQERVKIEELRSFMIQ